MNGNGKFTATENIIFYVSRGILTDKCNSYVFWNGTRRYGYRLTDT